MDLEAKRARNAAYARAWRAKNPDLRKREMSAYLREYYRKNKEKALAYGKAYYEANKNDPEYRAKRLKQAAARRANATPEEKAKAVEYRKAYRQRVKNTPEFKAKKAVWQGNRYQRIRARNEELFADFWKNGCVKCGWNGNKAALDAHHLDPTKKDIEVSRLMGTPNVDRIKSELAKCICVCANCHRKIHAELT